MLRLRQALPQPKASISYIYDLGDWWEHEIRLEKVLPEGPEHPTCLAGAGDDAIEHFSGEDDPRQPVPFNADTVNSILADIHT